MKKILYVFVGLVLIALIALICFGYFGSNKSGFAGPTTAEDPLPAALISDLEKYVINVMRQNDVPGVSMVLVHADEVVYSRGIGVSDLQTKAPVTTETLFGIGSSTKPITAVMMASLVDEGLIDWDTLVTNIMPSFALSYPQVTSASTIEHTLCMCTGVPRRMEEISVRYSEMTAEDIIESLETIPLSGAFEHQFHYSTRMIAAGGYPSCDGSRG